ncbi:helix-turn-helix domain-containing protein [Agarivorans sp. MS3-6]
MNQSADISILAKKLGHSHLRVAGEYWHLSDLLRLQAMLLEHAESLREGLIWWSKSISLLDRQVYIEVSESADSFLLSLYSREQQALPAWSKLRLEQLQQQLNHLSFATLSSKNNQLALQFPSKGLTQSVEPNAAIHSFAQKVYHLLQHQTISSPDIHSQLKNIIKQHLVEPLSINDVAKKMGLSTRTLQRRLRDKQLNFSQLIEDEKKTLALNLLADTPMPIASIALRLGYDDPSNFHRSFRRWFRFTPSFFRQQCLQNRAERKDQPVRLHYARGPVGGEGELHTQEGQVRLEVDNIAFEKVVTVECKDQDGVWRHYPAFFDDFLCDGTELWSTANLPVAQPLQFRLCYEVDGEKYIDDNQQRDYKVNERLLFGSPAYIVPTLNIIKTGFAFQLFVELACQLDAVAKVLCYVGENIDPLALQKVSSNQQYTVWTLSSPFPALVKQCQFRLFDQQNQELATQHYPQSYQFISPLL